jgi:hypothetical protein
MRQKENQRVLPGAQEHLSALGFATQAQYQLWCTANTLRAGFRKGTKEKERERVLREQQQLCELTPSQVDRIRAKAIAQLSQALHWLASNQRSKYLVNFAYLWELKPYFVKARRDLRVCEAFVLLLQSVFGEQFTRLRRFESIGTELAGELLALAQQSVHWVRSLENWKPGPRQLEPGILFSLSRHLLARYPVPGFFDSVWKKDNKAQQRWFRVIGQGRNLRELELPLKLTQKMAHIAMTEVPESILTLEKALRWAQIRGLGGSVALADAIVATPLGESFGEEPFWESVVHFFVNNPTLSLAQVGPLIDYLRFERYEPRWADEAGARLPVGFTMKGRTAAALLQKMQEWHVQLKWRSRFSVSHWPSCGLSGNRWKSPCPRTKETRVWELVELTEARILVAEGEAMHHCVASYGERCISGTVSIWSLRVQIGEPPQSPRRVLTVRVGRDRMIQEVRGKFNASPVPSLNARLLDDSDDQQLLIDGAMILKQWARESGLGIADRVL